MLSSLFSSFLSRLIAKASGAACVLILVGFAYAGLFPFDPSPPNGVTWLGSEPGLRFRGGSVPGRLPPAAGLPGACSLEVWSRPARNLGASTILAILGNGGGRLTLQLDGDSELRLIRSDAEGLNLMRIAHSFEPDEGTLLTVTSTPAETLVYVDGEVAGRSSVLRVLPGDCEGEVVLGTGASSDTIWNGDLLGIAVYDRNLSPGEVSRNHLAWSDGAGAGLIAEAAALYLFDERSGDVVHDRTGNGADLDIPESFRLPVRVLLGVKSWAGVRVYGLDWNDLVVNIAGFVPFGFFAYAFLTRRSGAHLPRRAATVTVSAGLAVSLTIEILQSCLPTRSSSLTDVLTNTAGTALGVLLFSGWVFPMISTSNPPGSSDSSPSQPNEG